MSSLVVKMLTVLVSTISNSQVFLLKKKCEYSQFFSKNISVYTIFNDQSFNNTLTNDIVSFEQLGPEHYRMYLQTKQVLIRQHDFQWIWDSIVYTVYVTRFYFSWQTSFFLFGFQSRTELASLLFFLPFSRKSASKDDSLVFYIPLNSIKFLLRWWKGPVQRSAVQSWADFHIQQDSNPGPHDSPLVHQDASTCYLTYHLNHFLRRHLLSRWFTQNVMPYFLIKVIHYCWLLMTWT